jgi:hypothetical protein
MPIRVGLASLVVSLVGCSSSSVAPGAPSSPADASTAAFDSGTGGSDLDAASSPADSAVEAGTDGAPCSPPAAPAQPQVLPGEVMQVTTACGVDGGPPPLVGPVPPTTMLSMAIGLPVRNQQQLNTYLQEVSDPTSPLYRHYLTPQQYTDMYGPTTCDYQAVVDWAKAQGLTVVTYSDRTLVDVSGPASAFNAALHVTFNDYQRPDGTQFYAPNADPSLDLGVSILAISGLDNCQLPQPG